MGKKTNISILYEAEFMEQHILGFKEAIILSYTHTHYILFWHKRLLLILFAGIVFRPLLLFKQNRMSYKHNIDIWGTLRTPREDWGNLGNIRET